jgi:hypothetical protein
MEEHEAANYECSCTSSVYACHCSGQVQRGLFTKWFHHIKRQVTPTEDHALLMLQGHNSHTRSLDVINLGRQHYVAVICLPIHTAHKMQYLDLSFMSCVKTYCAYCPSLPGFTLIIIPPQYIFATALFFPSAFVFCGICSNCASVAGGKVFNIEIYHKFLHKFLHLDQCDSKHYFMAVP